jgi:hypothetical protein
MWQKLRPKKANTYTKVISKVSVAIIGETHFKVNVAAIKVVNQIAVIQIQVGKNIVEDVLLDGGASVNIIT